MMLLAAVLGLSPASACQPPNPVQTLTIDPTRDDDVPPAPPVIVETDVWRGGSVVLGGTLVYSTCTWGIITLTVDRPDGDPDDEHAVGYRFRDFEGTLPEAFVPADYDIPITGPNVKLIWDESETLGLEPFDFRADLVTVDLAGNESEPVGVQFADEGNSARLADAQDEQPSGCATAPTGTAVAAWVGAAIGILRRSRPVRRNVRT